MGVPAIDLTSVSPQLRELVEEAARSGEVVLTSDGKAVAKIVPLHTRRPRQPGSAQGLVHMAEDFDATPEDFNDYL
jgi:antitoxin (DNA-binding transcriptional repressor) of toxin-antitoxin stability system